MPIVSSTQVSYPTLGTPNAAVCLLQDKQSYLPGGLKASKGGTPGQPNHGIIIAIILQLGPQVVVPFCNFSGRRKMTVGPRT